MQGRLVVLGVGPGAPDLITLRGLKLLQKADVVICPKGSRFSRAASIVKELIEDTDKIIEIEFENKNASWVQDACDTIVTNLKQAKLVAFAVEGDPSLYSSFFRVYSQLVNIYTDFELEIIPGVSSINAVAAAAQKELASGTQGFAVVTGWESPWSIKLWSSLFGNLVVVKPSKLSSDDLNKLIDLGIDGLQVRGAAHGAFEINTFNNGSQLDYFSTLILSSNDDLAPGVYFIGAGPGSPWHLTLKGLNILRKAETIIAADSLVSSEVISLRNPHSEVYNSSNLTLEQIIEIMLGAVKQGKRVARLHSGDISIYSAISEQIERLQKLRIYYELVPGVSSFSAMAAATSIELTQPGGPQSVVLTRLAQRTLAFPEEDIETFVKTGSSLVIFLSTAYGQKLQSKLIESGLDVNTEIIIAYKVSWPDEKVISCKLQNLARTLKDNAITRHALIVVPRVNNKVALRSRLYDSAYAHMYRKRVRGLPEEIQGDLAVVALTSVGANLARRIKKHAPSANVYVPESLARTDEVGFKDLSTLVRDLFEKRTNLILVMSLGIVARILSGYVRSKDIDPAVVVLDDVGRYAISYLGSVRASANRLAEWAASLLGARPIITTASYTLGLCNLEEFLRDKGTYIENPDAMKVAEAYLVNNGKLALYAPGLTVERRNRQFFIRYRHLKDISRLEMPGVAITDRKISVPESWVVARPRRYLLGLGICSSVSSHEVEDAVMQVLDAHGLARYSVGTVATIDKKMDHPAVLHIAEILEARLVAFSADSLNVVDVTRPSEKVQKHVGTKSVAEAACLLAGAKVLIEPKVVKSCITIALGRR